MERLGRKRIKISHNKTLFWIIVLLIFILIILILLIRNNSPRIQCVPACGCHPIECINAEEALDCPEIFCTEECKPETLDCKQGSCEFIDGKCKAVIK